MDTVIFVNEVLPSIAAMHDGVVNLVSSTNLTNMLRNFIGPIVLLALGIISLTFLVQRQMTQFIIFLVLAVVVLSIFYVPEWISNLGKNVGNETKNW